MRWSMVFVLIATAALLSAQEPEKKTAGPVEPEGIELLAALERVMEKAAQKVAPSVVSVYVDRDWLKKEGDEGEAVRPTRGGGGRGRYWSRQNKPTSGVIVDPDGYIATTHFNVKGKNVKSITVTLADGRTFEAIRLGWDENTDVAILKIAAKGLPAVKLDENASRSLRVGQFVAAVGRAEDRKSLTVDFGIVSAVGRVRGNAFQHSAKLNYGNTGGAMVDIHGNFLGLAAFVSTDSVTGQNSGVGFAAPLHVLKPRLADLFAGKRVERVKEPFLGVQASPDAAEKGAKVAQVLDNTAASRAGLKPGDVIVEFNGKKIENWDDLRSVIAECKVGQKVKMKVRRGKEIKELEAALGARPATAQ